MKVCAKRGLACALLAASLMLGSAAGVAGNAKASAKATKAVPVHELIRRIDNYYNHLHSLRAGFTETYRGMGISRRESGALLLRKPGKMRWSYDQPPGKVFILNGKYGWFYRPGDAQAQRIPVKEMDDLRSPLRFLLGHTHLEKEFENLTLTTTAAGKMELSGVPKGMRDRVSIVDLGIEPDGVIDSMTIRETGGAVTSFTFSQIQPNVPAPEADFVFHPPPGIPIVEGLPPV